MIYDCLTNSINLPQNGKTLKKNHYFRFKIHFVPAIPFTFRIHKLQTVFITVPVSHGRDNYTFLNRDTVNIVIVR